VCSVSEIWNSQKKAACFLEKKRLYAKNNKAAGFRGLRPCIFYSDFLKIQSGRPRKYDYYEDQYFIQYPDNAAF